MKSPESQVVEFRFVLTVSGHHEDFTWKEEGNKDLTNDNEVFNEVTDSVVK